MLSSLELSYWIFIWKALWSGLNSPRRPAVPSVIMVQLLQGAAVGESRNVQKEEHRCCSLPSSSSLTLSSRSPLCIYEILGLVNISQSLSALRDLLASCVSLPAYSLS